MREDKTCIHHDGALGDVLLSVPCIRAIREVSSCIHFIGRDDVGRLLCDAGIVREASPVGSALYASLYTDGPDGAAAAFLKGFRQAYVFTVNSDSLLVSNVRRFIPGTEVILTIPDTAVRMHVSEYRLRQVEGRSELHADLPVSEQGREKALHLLQGMGYDRGRKIITVHPGSGGKKKCWPLKNYLELMLRIKDHIDAAVIILTGPAEDSETKREIREYSAKYAGFMHMDGGDLTTIAALLGMSGLYVGNDSGISHLAGAVSAPSLVLFGPTDPLLWRPLGKQVHVLSSGYPGSLEDISVAEVYNRARDLLRRLP